MISLESYLHMLQLLDWDNGKGSVDNYSAITAKHATAKYGYTVSDNKYSYSVVAVIANSCYRTVRKPL